MTGCGYRVLLILLGATTGCFRPSSQPVLQMPVIHVRAFSDGDDVYLEAYDDGMLFSRAQEAVTSGEYPAAAELYTRLIHEFPESNLVQPSLYNLALCQEKTDNLDEAARSYETYLTLNPAPRDSMDATFRLAEVLSRQKQFSDIVDRITALLNSQTVLSATEKVEAFARRGSALLAIDLSERARADMEMAIRIYSYDSGITGTTPVYFVSQARFKLAEITHNEMRRIQLPPDDAMLGDILEQKCRLLLDSQNLYTRVIRDGHPEWAAAAAYRTGVLYHHLWEDMLAAPLPHGLTPEEADIYQELLRKRIRVLLEKAIVAWQRTIDFADRIGLSGQWVDEARADLKNIQQRLEIERQVGLDLPE